jgi:hypothetical protein
MRSFAASLLAVLSLSAPADAQAAVAPPARFESVLWCADLALGAAFAKQHGFTAVQLGRGGDPAPLVALLLEEPQDEALDLLRQVGRNVGQRGRRAAASPARAVNPRRRAHEVDDLVRADRRAGRQLNGMVLRVSRRHGADS